MMQRKTFDLEMVKTRRLIIGSTLALLVLGGAALLMVALGGKPLYFYAEILAGLAVVVFLLVLAWLLSYYLGRPEVKEKQRLVNQVRQNDRQLQSAQSALSEVIQKKASINERFEGFRSQEKEKVNDVAEMIQHKMERLKLDLEDALRGALLELQNNHLNTGLKAVPLDPAQIPGVGEVYAEKLASAGILTAHDVSQEAVIAIPGFGESRALSLMRWRESLEFNLRANQPIELSFEQNLAITQPFTQQIAFHQEELTGIQSAHLQTLEDLRSKEASELSDAVFQENTIRQNLSRLEEQKHGLTQEMAQFKSITFPNLLIAVFAQPEAGWKKKAVSYLAVLAFVSLGIANLVLLIVTLIRSRG